MNFSISAERYNALLANAAADSDVRYYLRGIYVDGENLVATDGHAMLVVPVPSDAEGVLAAPVIFSPTKRAPKEGSVFIDLECNQLCMFTKTRKPAGQFDLEFIDGKYPEYRRVIPDVDEAAPAPIGLAFNPGLLSRTTLALGGGISRPCFGLDAGPLSGFIHQIDRHPDVTAVVMPARW